MIWIPHYIFIFLLGLGRNDHHLNIMNTTISNFPTSMMTPSPSPDELIIQQRGRRKIPVTFSPDIDAIKQVSTYLCIRYILFLITFQHFTLFLSLGFFFL